MKRWLVRLSWCLVLGGLLLAAAAAIAQSEDPSAVYPKTQVINLPPDEINGTREGPAMSPIIVPKQQPKENLIRIREDFKPQVMASAHDL